MRRGQVALYLLMVLVGIFLIALLNVDTFDFVRGKNRSQNAGDAAALAAARKQGRLLNELGKMNVDHILAAVKNDVAECDGIVEAQRRLVLLGPVEALRLASRSLDRSMATGRLHGRMPRAARAASLVSAPSATTTRKDGSELASPSQKTAKSK
jgi:hypothetical protein